MNPPPGRAPATIRAALPVDLERVREIYSHHVLHGTATFEIEPPTLDEMLRRHDSVTGRGLPWLVAESGAVIVGYGYAGPYHARAAYRFTVEDSIYLDPAWVRHGVGRALLTGLVAACERAGRRQMVAVIGDSANAGSIGVHRALGFAEVGVVRNVGFKFGRWIDTVIMQRALGAGASDRPGAASGVPAEAG